MLLPIGLIYGVLYFFIFRFAIRKWNLKTPGREIAVEGPKEDISISNQTAEDKKDETSRGAKYLAALGGKGNIKTLGACATRLRLEVYDSTKINESALKALGTRGILNKEGIVQVIIGPEADLISDEIHNVMGK